MIPVCLTCLSPAVLQEDLTRIWGSVWCSGAMIPFPLMLPLLLLNSFISYTYGPRLLGHSFKLMNPAHSHWAVTFAVLFHEIVMAGFPMSGMAQGCADVQGGGWKGAEPYPGLFLIHVRKQCQKSPGRHSTKYKSLEHFPVEIFFILCDHN